MKSKKIWTMMACITVMMTEHDLVSLKAIILQVCDLTI